MTRTTRDELMRLLGTPASKATDLYHDTETGERVWHTKLRWDCRERARVRGLLDLVGPEALECFASNTVGHGEIDESQWQLEPCMLHDLQFRRRDATDA